MKDDRRRIVLCDVYPSLYGAQRSALTLYAHWQHERRYRLHFVYLVEGQLSSAMHEAGIATTRLDVGPLLGSFNKVLLQLRWWQYGPLARELLALSGKLKRFLIENETDLLHCNTDRAGLMCFLGAKRARCPMVTHMRKDRSFGFRDSILNRFTTDFVWVSERVREDFARVHGIADPKGCVIYNARVLRDADQPSTRDELQSEFTLPDNAVIALTLAGLDVRKDHETLIRAAGLACAEEPRLFFLLAGVDVTPGEERRRLVQSLIDDAGLRSRVRLLGHRDDAPRLLRGADLLVNPAKEEALGGALIEAIGYGVPIVATDAGGTAEIVPPDVCGLLVPVGDDRAMADCIVRLARDEEARRRFARKAREHFARRFTIEQCSRNTADFFDEVMARHRRRSRCKADARVATTGATSEHRSAGS